MEDILLLRVSGSFDGGVSLWSTEGSAPDRLCRLRVSSKSVSGIARLGEHLAVGCEDGKVYLMKRDSTLHPVSETLDLCNSHKT